MSISRSGTFNENPGFGEWAYGVSGLGTLTVDGGSVLTMTSSSGGGPYVRVGRFANGDGTITVTGTGSTVRIDSAGSTAVGDGAGLQIGRDGAVGVVNVLDGAALRIIDAVATSAGINGDEYLIVGRGTGGNGTLNVQGGEVELSGNGASLVVARDGATGALNVSQASRIQITNSPAELDRNASLTLGRTGSTGTATIDSSTVILENRGLGEAYLAVGRFGAATMTVTGTGATDHGVFLHGGSGSYAFVDIGRGPAGFGTLTVTDASLRLQNDGQGFDGASTGAGGDVDLRIGRDGGTGTLVLDGAQLDMLAERSASLSLGDNFYNTEENAGGTGTLTLRNGSVANIVSLEGSGPPDAETRWDAYVYVGDALATGIAAVEQSTLVIENRHTGEAYLGVGRFGTGTMTVTGTGAADHGVFVHGGDDDYAFVDIGRGATGNGTMTVTNATLRLQNDGVGFDGATYGAGGDAQLIIGRAGGTGQLTLNPDAKLEMTATDDSFILVGNGGDGTLTANDASIDLVAGDRAAITVGQTADSTAAASFTDGSTVSVQGARAGLIVGWGNGTGTSDVTFDASNLTITASEVAAITLGTPPPGEVSLGSGTGTLTLMNNASVTLDASIGQAGLLIGGGTGGAGVLNVTAGSAISMSGGTTAAEIGTNGGTGTVTVGQNSQIAGFDTAEIGSVGGSGRIVLQDGGTFGGAGSVTTLHQNGVLEAGAGALGGDLVVDGGLVDMQSSDLSRLDVMGNANLGSGRVRLEIGASTHDSIDIAGSAQIGTGTAGNTEFTVNLIEDRVLAAGETVGLLRATGGLTVSDIARLDAGVSGANAGFSWVLGVQAAHADQLALTALTPSDTGPGTGGTLDLAGNTQATAVWNSATAQWTVEGGAWVAGIATNLDGLSGTAFGDQIDARGLSSAIRITGGAGDDTFYGGGGDDIIIGGGGQDNVIYGAARAQYDIQTDHATGVTTVTDLRNPATTPDYSGTDTLTRVELLRFADMDVSLAVDTTIAITGRPGTGMTGVMLNATLSDGAVEAVGNTGNDGQVIFSTAAGGDIRITGTKPYDPATDGTITARDALDVLRLAVGLSPSWGSAAPLDFIAADINQDGQITAADALDVLRAAVGLQGPNQPRWFFIDSETDLSSIGRNNTSVDEGVLFNPLTADISGLGMTGILLGSMQDFAQ
ncbi:beta strand repeat-containing protein [Roseinatronobacter sp. NSM]|uniref:beta strand repeat-containing protein n=1 Tax=Roseinatronobacter sp. NSM TaxID=3457785 RepID=UPI0040354003